MTSPADVGEFLDKYFMLVHLQERARRPGRTIIDTPEIFQVIDPAMPIVSCNAVYRANFEESRVEERISETIGRFRTLGLPFRWAVNSLSSPKDLAERLAARSPSAINEGSGFAIFCDQMPVLPAPHVTIEDLSAGNLQDYILAAQRGRPSTDALKVLAQDDLASPDPDSLSFLARYKGQPAGIGRLRIVRDGARVAGYIGGGGVRPCFRHRPVLRMVSHFAQELQRRGIPLLLAHGNEKTSAPLMRRLGFREYSKVKFFVFSNHHG